MKYDIKLDTLTKSQPLAVVRRRASLRDLPAVIPPACGTVWNTLRAQQFQGAGRNVAVYLDSVFNLEVGVEVDTPYTPHGEVVPSSLPTGPVATLTHFGPYNQLPQAHAALRDWCALHGHTPAGPCWETYGHWTDACNHDPSHIRTDIFYLLKSAS